MGTIDGMKSILTQSALDALCEKFHIPCTVHPELPGRNDRIRNSPTEKIGVYTRFFDFANYRIPLSQFLVDIRSKRSDTGPVCYTKPLDSLKQWNDHFFWVDAFVLPLSVPWHNNKTLRKDPHPSPSEFNVNVCNYLAANLAPFKKFPEPFLCFVGICRYYELDVNYYPTYLTDDDEGEREVREGEVPLLELTRGRVVLLPGVNDQGDANIQGVVNEGSGDAAVADEIEESDHVVPYEGDNIVADDEIQDIVADKPKGTRKKRKAASGASRSAFLLRGLLDSSTLAIEVGVMTTAIVPFVTSFVSLTPECEGGRRTDSVTGPNLQTQHLTERFIVFLDSPCHSSSNAANAEVSFVAMSLSPDPPITTTVVATTVFVDPSSVPVPRADNDPFHHTLFADSASIGEANQDIAGPSYPAGTEFSLILFFVSQDMDSETLHQTYVPKLNLHSMDYDQLLVEFHVGAAHQTCLSSEVRLRLEHDLRDKKKLEGKCSRHASLLKERNAEMASLKAQLSFKEAEAAEAVRLRGQIATVKAAEAARASELDGLKERNVALEGQVAALKSATVIKDTELASSNAQIAKLTQDLSNCQLSCDELSTGSGDSLESKKENLTIKCYVGDHCTKPLSSRLAGLDSELVSMVLYLDEEFYPRFLTTIDGRRLILSRSVKLVVMKCLQSSDYLAALGGAIGRAIDKDFPLLAQLESQKDASIVDIMGLLNLEGPAAETPEANQLQASPEIRGDAASRRLSFSNAMFPLIEPLSAENLVGEASTSRVPAMATTTALSTTFILTSSVPPISVVDYEVLGAEPSTEVPSPQRLLLMEYLVKPIRRIQDFDELKDHFLTLKNTPYPHQQYAVYNTLVNEEEPADFTSIRRIQQEDTAYLCLHFTDNHEGLKSYTSYPGTSIHRIQSLLYMKILEDINRGRYSKKSPIRRIPHRSIRRIDQFPYTINRRP
ncbi:hypothetical protein Tco_0579331 [Tanacetum coccineum]